MELEPLSEEVKREIRTIVREFGPTLSMMREELLSDRIALKAEQEYLRQIVEQLYILIGNVVLKTGESSGKTLANQLRPFMQELKSLAEKEGSNEK